MKFPITMFTGIQLHLLVVFIQVLVVAAWTNPVDFTALQSLKDEWKNVPPNWVGADPCGTGWEGIACSKSRIVSMTLANIGLSGQLSGDIQSLSELQTLDLSHNEGLTGHLPKGIGNLAKLTILNVIGCGFSGLIPDSIGSLKQLVTLSLNCNKFIGRIPPSIGTLPNLLVLDLSDNKLSGSIPVSNGSAPGLDMLVQTKHFHFGKNQLSGEIPPQLFTATMTLIHLLLENNQLTGKIPATLGLVQTLEVVRLDRNSLSGPVPQNLSKLNSVQALYISKNNLNGPLPDLTGMMSLSYLDMSNNTFDASNFPPWFSTLQSLTTLVMENTQLQGKVPDALFSLPQLQSVILRNNQLNGNLSIGSGCSNELHLVDLQNNSIESFTDEAGCYDIQIILVDNPFCQKPTLSYCILPRQANSSYSTPRNCSTLQCRSDQDSSPKCRCAYPYTGTLIFRAPSFSYLRNAITYMPLEQNLMTSFQSHQLPVDSVSLSNPSKNLDDYLTLNLQVFPSGLDHFNRTGISAIAFVLDNLKFKIPQSFGTVIYHGNSYHYFTGTPSSSHKSSSTGIIVGAATGGSILLLMLLVAGGYTFRQKRRAEIAAKQIDPFALWDPSKNSGGVPQLKGARNISFEEVKKYTNNFSETNDIGSGGYGKVYKGTLPTGKLVVIKRAQHGSMQGGHEFKTEIELLSRVHHKNVVGLVGFCFDQGEEMLVYEYMPNGTLKNSLSGKSGIRLDWMRRLRIALGAARGIQYLHVLADPPIIHRDIKSNNVLLDERMNAKVADFGLSKPMGSSDRTCVTTQVKGTMGYMDPEYYMTQQLTEKSDVYSFGVVLLELVTARAPIENGKYIVREVKQAMDKAKDLYNLHELIDPVINVSSLAPRSLEKFVDLALSCLEEEGVNRPTMSEVFKEIESIMELAGLNPNAESASTSDRYGGALTEYEHPHSDESLLVYSGAYPHSK